MGMAHEGGACLWRGLVCVSNRCGSECLSDKELFTRGMLTLSYNLSG